MNNLTFLSPKTWRNYNNSFGQFACCLIFQTLEKCISVLHNQDDDNRSLSEVTTSASSDDVSGGWAYEWSLVHSLSPEWELNICDTDTQSRWQYPVAWF